jgi:ParB-like chromosome segregation protein Spo0J
MKRLKYHPLCEIFPRMNTAEFVALKDDIAKRGGIIEPIWIKDGAVIDGRHRLRACRELGIKLKDAHFREFEGDDIEAFVVTMNSARRHLSAQARASVVKKLLKMHPEQSDRAIAAKAKVSDKTVAAARSQAEANAEIPHKQERTEANGRKARGAKPKRGKNDFGAEHVTTPADLEARRIISSFRKLKACDMTAPLDYLAMFDVERERFANECKPVPISVNQ